MGREMGGRFKREGTYVYLWLIHADLWQKSTKNQQNKTKNKKSTKNTSTKKINFLNNK